MSTNGQPINNTDQPEFFEQFAEEERKDLTKIWEDSEHAAPARPAVGDEEINEAWRSVSTRTNSRSDSLPKAVGNKIQSRYGHWRWVAVAAAAVLLLIAGAGFLFTPKTATAPLGKMAAVTLPDGSTVKLNSGSEIHYNRLFGYTNRNIQMSGEAFFAVKKASQSFIVQANGTTVQVTGTMFNVRSWKAEEGTEVAVAEGRVLFTGDEADNHTVIIGPGQSSTLDKSLQQPTVPADAVVDRIAGWRNNSLMFNDRSLRVIFNELERRFDTHINIKTERIGEQTLSAYYANPRNLKTVLQDICRVKGLKFASTSNGYRVYD